MIISSIFGVTENSRQLRGWLSRVFEPVIDTYHDVLHATVPEPVRDIFTPTAEKATEFAYDTARDSYDRTIGPKNPISQGLSSLGYNKAAGLIAAPSWDEWGKPGEAFANDFDESMGILPPSWRQYAAPAVSTALNFVPGVGPLLSAGFTTAYNAGNMQRNQKGMDWGKVGIDAAKNVGTAAVSMKVGDMLKASQAAQGANSAAKATQTAANSAKLSQNLASGVGNAVGAGTGASLGSAIPQGYNLASTGSTLAAGSALARFQAENGIPGNSESSLPSVVSNAPKAGTPAPASLASFGDAAYNSALKSTPQLARGVADTLAPTGNQALSGFDVSGDITGVQPQDGYQFGDQLKAWRDPGATGGITPEELDAMTMRIGYNNYQQNEGARDTFLPAGQVESNPNTPYSSRLDNISKGTEKSYQDLLREVDNYNAITRIQDANPTFTGDEINSYIQDPTLTPETFRPYLQGLKPMDAFNTSMLR